MDKKLIKPNAKTIEAMLEARAGKLQSFNSVDELIAEIKLALTEADKGDFASDERVAELKAKYSQEPLLKRR